MRAPHLFFIFLCLFVSACQERAPTIDLQETDFPSLSAWKKDTSGQVLPAFLGSCHVFELRDPVFRFSLQEAGSIRDWLPLCEKAKQIAPQDHEAARRFFETYFTPYRIEGEGLFTGYYEASLRGSFKKRGAFQTPLYERPDDLVEADLGLFQDELKGKKLIGYVKENKFIPYDVREDIAQGSLKKRGRVLLWTDDAITKFFLEIQGSGRVQMEDGSTLHVGYAGQNGHPYTAIGRVLLERGALEAPVSMEKIRTWLQENPDKQQEIFNQNESYIFFKKLNDGPIGALNIKLTPLRSLAVDPRFIPLGLPLWLDVGPQKRLVMAQDVGGAIKGPVRGDLFWGFGSEAEKGAGSMQERGSYYLLLPKRKDKK